MIYGNSGDNTACLHLYKVFAPFSLFQRPTYILAFDFALNIQPRALEVRQQSVTKQSIKKKYKFNVLPGQPL